MPRRLLAIACAAGIALSGSAAGAIPLLTGTGGATDFGARVLNNVDDNSTLALPLDAPFTAGVRLAGVDHHSFYINNNGNVTFGEARTGYIPGMFPTAFTETPGRAMIAGWWADVDTRGAVASMAGNSVYLRRDALAIYVTWYLVGYYASHADLLNSFQLVLRRAPCGGCTDFEMEFRYAQCQWSTSDTSGSIDAGVGGNLARAGFDLPAGLSLELPTSGTASVLELCHMSNVGEPGRWIYCVHNGEPTSGPCAPQVIDAGPPDVPVVRDANARDVSPVDGGGSDAGPAPDAAELDASAPADARQVYHPPPFHFRGGGCQCAVTAGSRARLPWSARGAAAGLAAGAVLLLARRRRRARSSRA